MKISNTHMQYDCMQSMHNMQLGPHSHACQVCFDHCGWASAMHSQQNCIAWPSR